MFTLLKKLKAGAHGTGGLELCGTTCRVRPQASRGADKKRRPKTIHHVDGGAARKPHPGASPQAVRPAPYLTADPNDSPQTPHKPEPDGEPVDTPRRPLRPPTQQGKNHKEKKPHSPTPPQKSHKSPRRLPNPITRNGAQRGLQVLPHNPSRRARPPTRLGGHSTLRTTNITR